MPATTERRPVGWRQAKVYRFILAYQLEHNHGPSIREIGDGTGLTSTSSVAWHLARLEARGLLTREGGTRGTVIANELVTVRRDDLVCLLRTADRADSEYSFTVYSRLARAAGLS